MPKIIIDITNGDLGLIKAFKGSPLSSGHSDNAALREIITLTALVNGCVEGRDGCVSDDGCIHVAHPDATGIDEAFGTDVVRIPSTPDALS